MDDIKRSIQILNEAETEWTNEDRQKLIEERDAVIKEISMTLNRIDKEIQSLYQRTNTGVFDDRAGRSERTWIGKIPLEERGKYGDKSDLSRGIYSITSSIYDVNKALEWALRNPERMGIPNAPYKPIGGTLPSWDEIELGKP